VGREGTARRVDQTVNFVGAFDLCRRWGERLSELLETLGSLLDFAVGVSAHCLAVAVGRTLLAARRA
jgi:hypothetical protein